jgi:choline kinase
VKVLLLAAGAGSRMKELYTQPKPLIVANGKPLLWWSLQGFHELITSGTITHEDIYIAILENHKDDFAKNASLRNYFQGRDPYVLLEKPTNGPVQTAKIALQYLVETGVLSPNESVLISDSDHFMQSINIWRNLSKPADVYLWETRKDESLDWSFVSTSSPLKIVEKPNTTDGINVNRGLIGVYGFADNSQFLRAAENLLEAPEKEIFIS